MELNCCLVYRCLDGWPSKFKEIFDKTSKKCAIVAVVSARPSTAVVLQVLHQPQINSIFKLIEYNAATKQ